ncbi:MAG: type II toxin-antitoxin system HipA family toxin [Acidimicrobiia bacterium]
MNDTLVVALGGVVAGVLERDRNGVRFNYDDAYLDRPGATPLSVSMPLQARTHRSAAVTPWLWGLLPDNADVLERWARRFQASATSPFSLLATPVGRDCAGAVQFIPPERVDHLLGRPGSVQWLDDDQVAVRLGALRADTAAWLGPDFTGQFSLAGAQAKTALFFDGTRWGVPSGAAPTTHILKPAIAGLDDHDLNEHLCLDAAGRVGLLVARTRIVRFARLTAVAVDRYDRRRVGGKVERIHQEDLCQALGVAPQRKYQADGGPGPRTIARLLRDVVRPATVADMAVQAFLDALAWNWLIGGTDAHARNYSLLLAGDQVRLAPLYDVASVLPYDGVDEMKLKMSMKIGGDYRLKAHSASTWKEVAAELGLDATRTLARVAELAVAAPDAFRDAAAASDVKALRRPLTRRLVDAVADRSRRCAKQFASAGCS